MVVVSPVFGDCVLCGYAAGRDGGFVWRWLAKADVLSGWWRLRRRKSTLAHNL